MSIVSGAIFFRARFGRVAHFSQDRARVNRIIAERFEVTMIRRHVYLASPATRSRAGNGLGGLAIRDYSYGFFRLYLESGVRVIITVYYFNIIQNINIKIENFSVKMS